MMNDPDLNGGADNNLRQTQVPWMTLLFLVMVICVATILALIVMGVAK